MSIKVVTRHKALVAYLLEIGMIDEDTEVIGHATQADVLNHHIIGVLPLALAEAAASVTEIPLNLTEQDRGNELDLDRVREIADAPRTYAVHRRMDLQISRSLKSKVTTLTVMDEPVNTDLYGVLESSLALKHGGGETLKVRYIPLCGSIDN